MIRDVLLGDLGVQWKFGKLHLLNRLVRALLNRLHILLYHVPLLQPELPRETQLVVED